MSTQFALAAPIEEHATSVTLKKLGFRFSIIFQFFKID